MAKSTGQRFGFMLFAEDSTRCSLIQLQCQHASGADNCMCETGTLTQRASTPACHLFIEYAIVNQTHNGLRLPKANRNGASASLQTTDAPTCFHFLWTCCSHVFDTDPRAWSQSRIAREYFCHLALILINRISKFLINFQETKRNSSK